MTIKHPITVKNYLDRIENAVLFNDKISLNDIASDANFDFMCNHITYEELIELISISHLVAYAIGFKHLDSNI